MKNKSIVFKICFRLWKTEMAIHGFVRLAALEMMKNYLKNYLKIFINNKLNY
jgi:hypothetical protein